jgi:hypothetical protein
VGAGVANLMGQVSPGQLGSNGREDRFDSSWSFQFQPFQHFRAIRARPVAGLFVAFRNVPHFPELRMRLDCPEVRRLATLDGLGFPRLGRSFFEQRSDIGPAVAAGTAGKLGLEIRQPHVVGPALGADDDRMRPLVIAAPTEAALLWRL